MFWIKLLGMSILNIGFLLILVGFLIFSIITLKEIFKPKTKFETILVIIGIEFIELIILIGSSICLINMNFICFGG